MNRSTEQSGKLAIPQSSGARDLAFVIALPPIAVAIVGGTWTLYTYLNEPAASERQAEVTRRIEAQKPFLERKLTLFFEAAGVTGQLVSTAPNTPEWRRLTERFWALRWSELEMVGDPGTRQAMRKIGEAIAEIDKYTDLSEYTEEKKHHLRWKVECLADEMRLSLETSWRGISKADWSVIRAKVQDMPSGCDQPNDSPPP